MYICMYVCMYVCVCVYVYIYKHKHAHPRMYTARATLRRSFHHNQVVNPCPVLFSHVLNIVHYVIKTTQTFRIERCCFARGPRLVDGAKTTE